MYVLCCILCAEQLSATFYVSKFLVLGVGDIVDSGIEGCRTGPPGYIGWRAGMKTLRRSRLFPQSGTKNFTSVVVVCVLVLATEYTEWQLPLSGVQSTMMEKLAQPGEGGGCMSTPFHYIYHHVQSYVVRSC
jgi:hypothetical protein